MIHGGTAIAGNQQVITDRPDILRIDPLVTHATVIVASGATLTAESHAMAHGALPALPEVMKAEPGAGDFALRAVLLDDLREDAVVIANAITGGRIAERGERIEKAGGETTETAVAQTGIFFLGGDVIQVVTERLDGLAHFGEQLVLERGQRIDEAATEQELHRQIADPLHASARHPLTGGDPPLGKFFTNGDGQRVVDVAAGRVLGRLAEHPLEAIDDRLTDGAEAQRHRRTNRRSLRHENPRLLNFGHLLGDDAPRSALAHQGQLLTQRVGAELLHEPHDALVGTVRFDAQAFDD